MVSTEDENDSSRGRMNRFIARVKGSDQFSLKHGYGHSFFRSPGSTAQALSKPLRISTMHSLRSTSRLIENVITWYQIKSILSDNGQSAISEWRKGTPLPPKIFPESRNTLAKTEDILAVRAPERLFKFHSPECDPSPRSIMPQSLP